MRSWLGIGMMCGSSLDGTDLSLCRYTQSSEGNWNFEFIETETVPYGDDWDQRLRILPKGNACDLVREHAAFGHYLGRLLASFRARVSESIEVVGVHGHTVFHDPANGYSFQLGAGEAIAAFVDSPTVCDFRLKDISVGGQGAPLVPVGERCLFPEIDFFVNLGGIVNLTTPSQAYDICTGNQVLNDLAEKLDPTLRFDPGGHHAAQGRVNEALLQQLESLDYVLLEPPKSLGREWYESDLRPRLEDSEASPNDLLATYTEHIALQVARALMVEARSGSRVLVTGGGWYNTYLLDRIRSAVAGTGIDIVNPASADVVLFKEALIFGFLGLLSLLGEPNIDGRLTGARESVVGGSLHHPLRVGPQR